MIKLLVGQNQPAQALSYAERIKGRVLLDVMRHGRIDVDQSIDEKERLEEQRLNAEVVSINSELRAERARPSSDSARIKSLETRLDKARAAYESFQTLLYAAHPQLRLKHGELPSFSLDETSKGLLDANSAVLEYVITEDVTYLFVLSKDRGPDAIVVRVFPINVSSKVLAERVAHFRGRVLKRLPDFAVVGRELYNLLIMPAEATLKGKSTVCIVPDGALWDLPFQALMSGAGRYLLEDHAIYFTPSLQVLKEIRTKATNRNSPARRRTGSLDKSEREQLFAMGNPTIVQGTLAAQRPMRDDTFSPLPDAEVELQTIARIYGQEKCRIYTGSNAREETFKREASRYRMIHLASHAVLDDSDPLYSYVLLAANEDSKEDGLLEARELIEMNLGAELVVLSACETGGGRIRQGEGVVGMTWALFLSGVPTTLASQWKIPSYATARLMPEFYRNIGQNMSKAEAWRRTVLEFIKDPTYRFQPLSWAGFIIIGDGESQIVSP
jgi:CHAT domain-containing protein